MKGSLKGMPLSARETQVHDLSVRGTKISHIAKALGLSVKTVSTYRARILEKLSLDRAGWSAYLESKRAGA